MAKIERDSNIIQQFNEAEANLRGIDVEQYRDSLNQEMHRRSFLKLLGLTGGGLMVAAEGGLIASIINTAEGPVEILLPNATFRSSPSLETHTRYIQDDPVYTVGFGDSNMWRWFLKKNSYLHYVAKDLRQKGLQAPEANIYDFGIDGATSVDVFKQITCKETRQRLAKLPFFDLHFNFWGDDFFQEVNTPKKASEMEQAINPFPLPHLAWSNHLQPKIVFDKRQFNLMAWDKMQDIVHIAKQYKSNFSNNLNTAVELYGAKIRNMYIIFASNAGKYKTIVTTPVGGGADRIYANDNPIIQSISSGVSILVNNEIADTLAIFMQHQRFPVKGVNIYDNFSGVFLLDDEHWSDPGKKEVAHRAVQDTDIKN